MEPDRRIGRRSFVRLVGKASAGAALLLGTSVRYTPRAFALHNTKNCLTPKQFVDGPCTVDVALGNCAPPGELSCANRCSPGWVWSYNPTSVTARLKCTCHDKRCCWIKC